MTVPDPAETLPAPDAASGQPSPESQQLYPGSLMPARQWANPRGAISLGVPSLGLA